MNAERRPSLTAAEDTERRLFAHRPPTQSLSDLQSRDAIHAHVAPVDLSAEVGDQALQSEEDFVPYLSLARHIPQAYVLLRGFQGLVPARAVHRDEIRLAVVT